MGNGNVENCIFCKIVKGDIQSLNIYESSDVLAFLDISPANKGHTLVIPKKHYETLADIPDDLLVKLIKVVKKAAKAISNSLNADGFNTFISSKRAAGQVIPHAHFHIVPRFEGDGIKFEWPTKKYENNEINEYKEKISNALKS